MRLLVSVAAGVCAFACASPEPPVIVFSSTEGTLGDTAQTLDIFTMREDGSHRRQLTNGTGVWEQANFPTGSPDGRQIAFLVQPLEPGRHSELHLMASDGTNDRLLVRLDSLDVGYPEWALDGRRLAFIGSASPTREGNVPSWVYVVDADGRNLRRVSREAGFNLCAGWLPSGDAVLVSEAVLPGARSTVTTLNVASGESQVLVRSDSLLLCPVPAPDGGPVLITGQVIVKDATTGTLRAVQTNAWQMNPDGSALRPFVTMGGFSKNPRWSRDGRSVVFHGSNFTGFFRLQGKASFDSIEVFLADSRGLNIRQLTRNRLADLHPSW
jgi:Tol biopolymer transport system component